LADTNALADVLERRIALESDPKEQAPLYHRLSVLQIKEFGEKLQGLATLRAALEKVPEHAPSREALEELLTEEGLFDDAFDALEGVYRALGASEKLATLYEKRVQRALTARDRSRLRLELARVLEEVVKDPARAQRVIEEQIAEDPSDPDALSEIE